MSDLFQGIASLTKTVQQTFNSYEVRKLGDKVQGYVMNFTETEQKVREATNEDPWGPTGPEMQEIASLTFQYDQFSEVMGMLWKRMLQDNKVAWRRVYKSLILLNHLLKNGSERVISTTRDHMFELRALESYKCLDERGKDEGINVRHRAKLILELLNDEELLRTERRKAKTEGKEKYQGFSKDDMLVRGGGASSKFDSFERWNEKKESRSMDFNGKKVDSGESGGGGTGGRREVTAFDFDESRSHANGSPELGIRERTPEPVEVNDDDDFGDFTSARATNKTPSSVAVASIQSQSAIKLQAFSPSNALKSNPNAAKAPRPPSISSIGGGGDIDLLGIGDFGNNSKLAANPTPQPINSNILLDDLFSNTTSPTPVQKTNSTNAPDLFDLFSSPPQSTINTEQNRQELFNPLAGGFAQSNANGMQANSMPVASFPFDEQKPQPSKGNNAKLGSTWEDLKGKVNIDFDNLSLKNSPTKATPSLNELKNSTPKEPNLGSGLW